MAIGTPTQRKAQTDAAQTTTTAVVPATTVAAGSVCVLAVANLASKTIGSVADSVGNTWAVDATLIDAPRAVGFASCQVATQITSAGSVTVTWSAATSAITNCWLLEVTGLATSSPFDKTGSGTGTGTAVATTATATLSQADEVVFGCFRHGVDSTFTPGATYTGAATPILSSRSMLEFKIVAATTAVVADGTMGTSSSWCGLCVTYKGAAAAGGALVFDPQPLKHLRAR